jgi:hypothetical protein
MGFGIGVFSKHYDEIKNPNNNVIGSTFNNITQFKLGFDWKINSHVYFSTCGSFTHWSNAKIQNPNLGINLGALTIGLKVFPGGGSSGATTTGVVNVRTTGRR